MEPKSEPNLKLTLGLSGIAPNVIRELSGVYPTFVSAFKELISNAYDADASYVDVEFSPGLEKITVSDNGKGMTPFELQNDYLRIGGSTRRQGHILSDGRRPIGRKGIGFLAIARYCKKVVIHSHSTKIASFEESQELTTPKNGDPYIVIFQNPFTQSLTPYIKIDSVRCEQIEIDQNIYSQDGTRIYFHPNGRNRLVRKTIDVQYSIDCSFTDIYAEIDYEYLLNLSDAANLANLEDFCKIRVLSSSTESNSHFTKLILWLDDFTKKELNAVHKRGRVRNIASTNGLDRFIWHLSRSTPIPYNLSPQELEQYNLSDLNKPISPTPFIVKITKEDKCSQDLKRPILGLGIDSDPKSIITRQAVSIDTDGLVAYGYLLGLSRPIYPAELRGIAIRVSGVEIGHPNFLNAENSLPSRLRPFLSQIIGEIIVSDGLDANQTILPGREGFYEDSHHFRVLQQTLVGDGFLDIGILGKVLEKISEHYAVVNTATRLIQEARQRKTTLMDISQTITEIAVGSGYGRSLRKLFTRKDIFANGLSGADEHHFTLPNSVGSYTLKFCENLEHDYEIDLNNNILLLNHTSDIWESTIYVLGRDFIVSFRNGKPNDPLCEIDFQENIIYINWMHPSRGKLGDTAFVKSALFWRLAYLASDNDVDKMMNLAHTLIAYTS